MEKTEGMIKKEVLDYLERLPACFVFPVFTGGLGNYTNPKQKGCPDLVGCYRGLFIAFEIKTPKGLKQFHHGKLNAHLISQKNFHIKIRHEGWGKVFVISSVDEAIEAIESLKGDSLKLWAM